MPRRNRKWFVSLLRGGMATCLLLSATTLAAQQRSAWQIDFHVGGGPSISSNDGTASLPSPAASFVTVVDTPSRKVPSWYFGDGALLLNQVNAALGVPQRITPLDPVLAAPLAELRQGAIFGFRATRSVTPRFAVEFSIDYSLAQFKLTDAALDGIEASRASFVPAWTGLIATGPFPGSGVTSVTTVSEHRGQQVLATGAVVINFETSRRARTIPYVTVGGGMNVRSGQRPSVQIDGAYRFQILGVNPVSEVDKVILRSSVHGVGVGIVGGGLKYMLSRRLGIRFDVRGFIGKASSETLVDAHSAFTTGTPVGATASLTTPSLQFSNNASLGQSSIGAQLNGFRSFEQHGLQTQTAITIGLVLAFY